jgi:hypothetical protein
MKENNLTQCATPSLENFRRKLYSNFCHIYHVSIISRVAKERKEHVEVNLYDPPYVTMGFLLSKGTVPITYFATACFLSSFISRSTLLYSRLLATLLYMINPARNTLPGQSIRRLGAKNKTLDAVDSARMLSTVTRSYVRKWRSCRNLMKAVCNKEKCINLTTYYVSCPSRNIKEHDCANFSFNDSHSFLECHWIYYTRINSSLTSRLLDIVVQILIGKAICMEPGSSGSVVSGYGLDDRAIEVRSPAEAKQFFF